ncbi:hypothetical protein N0A02_00360 [Paraburkholderia acidicola]|uniref:Uncharacterized protein n=1 Tax=Paraburkholderia acidicola TaxID=1912599 RepID=A0ABV1LFZ4_9BURK
MIKTPSIFTHMPILSLRNYSAFPSSDTETSEATRERYIGNLARELPLATQRRTDKRDRYIEAVLAYIKAGNDPKKFRIEYPGFHLADPDTALLYCLFGKEGNVEYCAPILGVPTSALQLYCFIHETKMHEQQVFAQSGRPVDDGASADRFGVEWIKAIDPGDDLGLVPTRLVHWLLTDPGFGVAGLAVNPELRLTIERVAKLHLRLLERNPPTRDEWKSVQKSLLEFADNASSSSAFGEIENLIVQVIENSATDCSNSDVIGDEIVVPFAQLHAQMQVPDANYTAEEVALKEHIEKLTRERDSSLAEERKRPEIKALYSRIDDRHSQILVLRAEMVGRVAMQFIAMTRDA